MFGKATIPLGVGPHSSLILLLADPCAEISEYDAEYLTLLLTFYNPSRRSRQDHDQCAVSELRTLPLLQ